MSFKDNIFTAIGITDLTPIGFKLTLIGKSGIYLEGVKSLLDVTPFYIDVDVKNKIISLKGNNLNVTSLSGGDVAISGEITSVELKDKKNEKRTFARKI